MSQEKYPRDSDESDIDRVDGGRDEGLLLLFAVFWIWGWGFIAGIAWCFSR